MGFSSPGISLERRETVVTGRKQDGFRPVVFLPPRRTVAMHPAMSQFALAFPAGYRVLPTRLLTVTGLQQVVSDAMCDETCL